MGEIGGRLMVGLSFLASLLVALAVGAALLGVNRLRIASDSLQGRIEDFVRRPASSLEELELQQPFADRVLRPLLGKMSSIVARLLPQRNLERIRRDLVQGGVSGRLSATDFMGLRFVAAVALGFLSLLCGVTAGIPLFQHLMISVALLGLGSYLPNYWVKRRIRARQHEISRALPDALDMLTICVGAGLAFDLAMLRISDKWDNALSEEFDRIVAEMRMGVPRREALRHMSDRTGVTDVGNFVAVLVQADQLGVSVEQVLRTQSDQLRVRRQLRAQELANQAPVKMVFPLVLLILPALFGVILGPAVPALLDAVSGFSGVAGG